MSMRVVKELPPDLTRLLFELGPRKLVLVEGQSDCIIFREWYRDRLSEVEFFAPEVPQGGTGVQHLLAQVLALSTSTTPREYGIIDRDFRDDAEVDAPLQDPHAHLFVLRRYSIENYLLEPAAVAEELRVLSGSDPGSPGSDAIAADLLRMCSQLRPMMAANWLCYETKCGSYYREAHDIIGREAVVTKVARDHGCSREDADQRLAGKEALLEPYLSALSRVHSRISGKHLLFHVHKRYTKTGINKDQFRNLLARAVKDMAGVHEDIKRIIDQRVLASRTPPAI